MRRPQAVVFDLGKVLLDFDYGRMTRALESACAVKGPELLRVIDQSPLLHDYESGRITTRELFAAFKQAAGYGGDFDRFSRAFADIFQPIPPMLGLHRALRQQGVPVFIFSNTNELAVDHIRREFPFFAEFDGHVFSHQVGAMKPAPAIYAAVEATTGRGAADLLYIDDRPENVQAGRERGWQVIWHQDPAQTIAAVQAAGLL